MTTFSATTTSEATVAASREDIWAALTDPVLLPKLTPFLRDITVDGDLWRWEMTKVPILNLDLVPIFTEKMEFDEPVRIEYFHSPPAGETERAGVGGRYDLTEVEGGTRLKIRLDVEVELPLSRVMAPAVRAAMKAVMATMGQRFSRNLLRHLGVSR